MSLCGVARCATTAPITRSSVRPSRRSPGILACLDGYMNIAMEQTEEYVNGQLKNKYGDCFIRGERRVGKGVRLQALQMARVCSAPIQCACSLFRAPGNNVMWISCSGQ